MCCIVCIEYEKGKLTKLEAEKAFTEVLLTDPNIDFEHIREFEALLGAEEE